MKKIHGTTILTVRKGSRVAIGGDGQVTLGDTIVKADARKIRRLGEGRILVGFAGSVADCFSLLERFEEMLRRYGGNTRRSAIELAKLWRTDRVYRRLEALLAVVDREVSLLVGGTGDVIEPSDGVIGIGAGGSCAVAAARALLAHADLEPAAIVRAALEIAGDISIYTNRSITLEEL
ncbi:MAG: ATP-dependent protease subunit HslV [Planctomycetes bacterium]|nr:ATP-dependent protease subunit HslV [Planctomycetota bacterium]